MQIDEELSNEEISDRLNASVKALERSITSGRKKASGSAGEQEMKHIFHFNANPGSYSDPPFSGRLFHTR